MNQQIIENDKALQSVQFKEAVAFQKEFRAKRRSAEVAERSRSCLKPIKLTTAEKAQLAHRYALLSKKFAKLFKECFDAETRLERKWMWRDVKKAMANHRFKISFSKLRKMLALYNQVNENQS